MDRSMNIRRFQESDAAAVSELIRTTLQITNSRDYLPEIINALIERETPDHILQRASWTHFYVAEADSEIIGSGAIGSYWDRQDESSLFTIFVRPDCQGKGVGKAIVETLERDPFALRAKRIEIPASITGLPFYLKMGYSYKNGIAEPDEERLYRLEKHRKTIIRVMNTEDYDRVYALWMSCKNMGFNNLDDSRQGIEKYLKRNPSTCFVAEQGDDSVPCRCRVCSIARDFINFGDAVQLVLKSRSSFFILEGTLIVFDGFLIVALHRVILCRFKQTCAVVGILFYQFIHHSVGGWFVEPGKRNVGAVDLRGDGIGAF